MKAAVLVVGATGIIGQGVAQAVIESGRPLIAVARDPAELAQLQAAHPRGDILALSGSIASDGESQQLAMALRDLGRPIAGIIVAISGHADRGRLLDQPADVMRRKLDAYLLPHLSAARHLLPLLTDTGRGGSYVLIGGPGSQRPWAGYAHRSVAAAALRMLAWALHEEARALGVRLQLLSVDVPACGEHNRLHACSHWPSVVAIGRRALELVERGDAEPPHAIVSFAAPAPPRTVVPFAAPAPPHSEPVASEPAGSLVHDTNREVPLLTERWLQDARTLLQALTPSNPNEVSPHDSP